MENRVYKILFTSVGRRVELIQAYRKAALKENIKIRIYAADMSDKAPALFFCDEIRKVCRISDIEYIPQLKKICKDDKIDLLIPTIDTDLLKLAESKHEFEALGTKVLISDPEMIRICRDKRYTGDFFESCGLKAPKCCDKWEEYKYGYPCFIKPKDGSSSINAYKVDTKEELIDFAQRIPNYIIQPFIDGKEYTIDVFCDLQGEPIFITPRERVAVRSGEVLQTKIVQDDVMIAECKQLIEKFKPCGPITVQLIQEEKSKENYYIEINPRYGGGAPLSMKAGADSASVMLQLLNNQNVLHVNDMGSKDKAAKNGRVYSRFDQSIEIPQNGKVLTEIFDLQEICQYTEDKKAIIFDLDDTLYNERDYVKSGYQEVAKYLVQNVVNEKCCQQQIADELYKYFEEGKPAFDTWLLKNGIDSCVKEKCIQIYREHMPNIQLATCHKTLLLKLRNEGKQIGIITDGRGQGQRNKIQALGLYELVDEVIITDELAGKADVTRFRKPNSLAFQIMQQRLNVEYSEMIYVGDNIHKDFQAPFMLGMMPIWFHNDVGLYNI